MDRIVRIEVFNDVFVRRLGALGAPKLICLHGFADSGQMFAPLSETALGEEFELVVPDLPGFGASPRDSSVNRIRDFARAVAAIATRVSPGEPVGLIGHSIASAIAVDTVAELPKAPLGVFSIEGNLTEEDAYFSGKAAEWDSASSFKEAFCAEIWRGSERDPELRRYFGGVVMADAEAMWNLGRDARRVSVGDAVGRAYRALDVPTLYYWGLATTSERTREFIESSSLPNRRYEVESHWPTVASPAATATAIGDFFSSHAR